MEEYRSLPEVGLEGFTLNYQAGSQEDPKPHLCHVPQDTKRHKSAQAIFKVTPMDQGPAKLASLYPLS